MKVEREFFVAAGDWTATAQPGVSEQVLSADGPVIMTRLARWDAGTDTSSAGVIRHDYVEEVHLLAGELTDLTLGVTFGPGAYACRRPGMPHGPYLTATGCLMLEVRSDG